MRASIALFPLLLIAACDRQPAPAPQPNAADTIASTPEPAGALDTTQRGKAAPSDAFTGPDGKPVTLAAFKGRPVLVNLWATWCGPCVKEMPSLDRLSARGKGKLTVITINQGDDAAAVTKWWAARALPNLSRYRDDKSALGFAFETGMLPTTVLYDAGGKEVWRITGGMDWDGDRAKRLLAEALR